MPRGDELDLGLTVERIVDPHNLYTWKTENVFDAFAPQSLNDRLATCHLRHGASLLMPACPLSSAFT
jgi:hypothetical protein